MVRTSARSPGPERAPEPPAALADSWARCRAAGPDPVSTPPTVLVDDALAERRERHPLAEVLPLVRGLLEPVVEGRSAVFAVADERGSLLWVEGDAQARRRTERMGFGPGTDWSEPAAGTNAPGTCLVVDGPVVVRGQEHYLDAVKPWSCAAAPVHDPDGGATLGVLDLTGGKDVADPRALAMVRATVGAVEGELARRAATEDLAALAVHRAQPGARDHALLSRGGRVLDAPWPMPRTVDLARATGETVLLPDGRQLALAPFGSSGHVLARLADPAPQDALPAAAVLEVLGRDSAVLELDGRRVRLGPRHSEIAWLLSRAPDGMSAARLAVHLSESEVATGTIRVDMSRLRDVLGERLLGSVPYRLQLPVTSDDALVAEHLEAGRVAEALARYRGPLLPGSQAPTVVEHRDALHLELRAAVLASRDARLVGAWVHAPWGEDDPIAWRVLAAALPPGSPQRAAAASRAGLVPGRAPTAFPQRLTRPATLR